MNKGIKYISLIPVFLILMVALFLFIGRNDDEFSISVNLYFSDESSMGIVGEMRDITYDKPEQIIPKIIKEIAKGPIGADKNKVVKTKLKLKDIIYEENGYAVIDLADGFLSGDNTEDILSAYTVIKSVCSVYHVTGITHVKLTVCGEDITTTDGKSTGYLSYDDIKLSDTENVKQKEVLLYFQNSNKEGLGAEIRTVEISDTDNLEKALIEALLKGPKSEKLKQTVFGELISAETKDNVCFVNFAFSFVEKNSGADSETAIMSVVKSLLELQDVDGVQFLIDGKKIDKIGDVDISSVFR